MVKKLSPKYTSEDGREFNTEADAKKHEELITAKSLYDQARHAYARKLWETQKTADGEPFELGWRRYWRIVGLYMWPRLQEVSIYPHSCDLDDQDALTIIEEVDNGKGGRQFASHRISDLYCREENAKKALIAAQRERLDDLTREVVELIASVEKTEKR